MAQQQEHGGFLSRWPHCTKIHREHGYSSHHTERGEALPSHFDPPWRVQAPKKPPWAAALPPLPTPPFSTRRLANSSASSALCTLLPSHCKFCCPAALRFAPFSFFFVYLRCVRGVRGLGFSLSKPPRASRACELSGRSVSTRAPSRLVNYLPGLTPEPLCRFFWLGSGRLSV